MGIEKLVTSIQPQIAYGTATMGIVGTVLFAWSLRFLKDDVRLRDVFRRRRWWPSIRRLEPLLNPPGFKLLVGGYFLLVIAIVWRLMFLDWHHWW